MGSGRLFLRLAVGGFFVGHGTQKLFGWFGGPGLDATAEGFEQIGLRPGRTNAIAAGAAEAGGGALLAVGVLTPVATAALTATMLTAIQRVHWKNGPWIGNGGYEYNVVLIAALLALAEAGPGALAVDAAPRRHRRGRGSALRTLGVGALGAFAARELARRTPAPAPAAETETGSDETVERAR